MRLLSKYKGPAKPVSIEGENTNPAESQADKFYKGLKGKEKQASVEADRLVHNPKNYPIGSIPVIGSGKLIKKGHHSTRAVIRRRKQADLKEKSDQEQKNLENAKEGVKTEKKKSFLRRCGL